MADNNKKQERGFKYWVKRLWQNFIVRNIVLLVSVVIIFVFIVTILLNVFTRHNKYKDVPDFEGVTLEQAYSLARKDKLKVEVNDSLYVPLFDPGVILEQQPAAGTKVKSGRRIFVTVNSFSQKMVEVPYVAGYSLRQAKSILETAGLEVERLVYVPDIATNNVLEQRVNGMPVTSDGAMRAEMGTGVVLKVGKASDAGRIITPRVVGLPLREAKSRLWDVGLNVGNVSFDPGIDVREQRNAKVYMQSPDQGAFAELGQDVQLRLSLDSLMVKKGSTESDVSAGKMRRQHVLADSLRRAGYSGEALEAELEWLIKLESGQVTPEEAAERYRQRTAPQTGPAENNDDDGFFF